MATKYGITLGGVEYEVEVRVIEDQTPVTPTTPSEDTSSEDTSGNSESTDTSVETDENANSGDSEQ